MRRDGGMLARHEHALRHSAPASVRPPGKAQSKLVDLADKVATALLPSSSAKTVEIVLTSSACSTQRSSELSDSHSESPSDGVALASSDSDAFIDSSSLMTTLGRVGACKPMVTPKPVQDVSNPSELELKELKALIQSGAPTQRRSHREMNTKSAERHGLPRERVLSERGQPRAASLSAGMVVAAKAAHLKRRCSSQARRAPSSKPLIVVPSTR
jgi:hypothetical protein